MDEYIIISSKMCANSFRKRALIQDIRRGECCRVYLYHEGLVMRVCPLVVFSLQEEYPLWFERPVLEMVHHNTVSLDKLVDQAWVEILTKYAVDEECDFLVSHPLKRTW